MQKKVKKLLKYSKNSTKGITLIALVVTIVVLLILAGVSINLVFGQNGIINMAKQAAIAKAQAEREEEVRLAITNLLLKNEFDKSKITVSAVVEEVKKNYSSQEAKNSISGESTGEVENRFPGIVKYEKPSSSIDGTIIVEVDENLNVTSKLDQPEPPIELPQSEYKKVGETYYNTPELTKFNPENTYYITYDESGENETVYGRIDKVPEPDNWYNYEAKIWANLATVNGDEVTYWTWIPRYMYKIGEEETANETVDVKFVDVNNNYQGKDEKTINLEEYQLPESFTFAEKELSGYWMSKYEVQESSSSGLEKLQLEALAPLIYVTTTNPIGTYTIFVDGVKHQEGVELPYYIEGVESNKKHDILLVSETRKNVIGNKTISANINDSSKNIVVDTSGFKPENTYYVVYDEEGNNETIYGRMDKVDRPTNWYNYDKKIWANLVTVNGDQVTYWTYIPRYEYITYPLLQYTDVRYITTSTTKENVDAGYKIPESFTFGGKELAGYWMSKYEVQESSSSGLETMEVIASSKTISVTTTNPVGKYIIFIDGKKYEDGNGEGVELPYTIEGMQSDREYDVCLVSADRKNVVGNRKIKTNIDDSSKNIEIDLRGFNTSCTYYVTYDEKGENEEIGDLIKVDENGTPINPPTNWYNYDKKIWANIVTKGTDESGQELITYWTYIPRYEYITYPLQQYVDIRFIKTDITTAKGNVDAGYKIPESFTFAGKELKGYWITKYEIQNSE